MTTTPKSSTQLIEEGQPLVHSLAMKIFRNVPVRVDLDDLIAYGEVGLAEAARDFNPERGSQFTTFAYYRIRGAIYDGLSKMTWASRAQYRRLRYQQMANEALAQKHGKSTGTLEDDARWLFGVTEKLAVVYLATNRDDGAGAPESTLEDPSATAPSLVASREINQRLRSLVEALPTAERRLIESVYYEGATLQEAAVRLGISKSWASRLHARVLENLARQLRGMGASD